MLDRYGPRYSRPLGEPDPPPDDWSVPTLIGLTHCQLGRRADACGDAIVSGWLTDLMFLIGPYGPINPGRRTEIAGLVAARMGRPPEPGPRKGLDP